MIGMTASANCSHFGSNMDVKGLRYLKMQHAKQVKQAKLSHPASLIVQPNAVSLRHGCYMLSACGKALVSSSTESRR
jgi:hypothetical protein